MDSIQVFSFQFDTLSGEILNYAVLLTGVGTLSMALVEFLKAATRIRRLFHDSYVRRWIKRASVDYFSVISALQASKYLKFFAKNFDAMIRERDDRVLHELLQLSVADETYKDALFDQPTQKMMGQIQAAANTCLEFPSNSPFLYFFLTGQGKLAPPNPDAISWFELTMQSYEGLKENQQVSRKGTQARARLDNLIARKLDALQTSIEYYWARLNQLTSVVIGSGILFYIFGQTGRLGDPLSIPLALLGGLTAPFAKDVVAAVSELRSRK